MARNKNKRNKSRRYGNRDFLKFLAGMFKNLGRRTTREGKGMFPQVRPPEDY